jgi:thiamine transport system substrate-binding protein
MYFALVSVAAKGHTDSGSARRSNEVVIYAYDSFVAEWGPAPLLARLFEEKTGYRCTFVDVGDGAQVLSRAMLEKKRPQADVLLGLDNNLVAKAISEDVLVPYKPALADSIIKPELRLDENWHLTPFDWSYFAIVFDSAQAETPAPASLQDLTKAQYAKKLILMDPRTSTPGLGFVAWTVAVFGEGYADYWKALKPNILTLSPSWSTGYGLFTAGEAPLAISYTTSPAYHVEYDNTDRYKALIFAEGHPTQIEGAGVAKGAPNAKGAQAFIDFLITEEAQAVLPLTQWMYPVNERVTLPPSYRAAPKSPKTLAANPELVNQAVKRVIAILSE